MTNREHYKKEIEKIVYEEGDHIAIKNNGSIVPCRTIDCDDCKFDEYDNCNDKRVEWFNEEYVEPPIDWSKIPVDTKILVRNSEDKEWERRYFATYENGKVYAFNRGGTSWSVGNCCYAYWKYAKLAKEDE